MSDDGELELWPDEFRQTRRTRLVRFSPPPRVNDQDVGINYRYVVPRPETPPKEPTTWLGRTKAEVAEDNKFIAKHEAAQREAEEEGEFIEIVRRRRAKSPSPEQYVYEARSSSSRRIIPNITICASRRVTDPRPPPKAAVGPKKPKDDDRFYVVLDDGQTCKMRYSLFKDADGHWMSYPDDPGHWYFVMH